MQLELVPGLGVPLGVLVDPAVTDLWQQGNGLFCRLPALHVKSLRFCRLPYLIFGWSPFLLGNLGRFNLLCRLLPSDNGRGVPVDVADQFLAQMLLHQDIMNKATQTNFGIFGKSTRKGGPGDNVALLERVKGIQPSLDTVLHE